MFLKPGLDCALVDFEPFGHAIHGKASSAGGGELPGDRGGRFGSGSVEGPVVVPRLADALVVVVWIWVLGAH